MDRKAIYLNSARECDRKYKEEDHEQHYDYDDTVGLKRDTMYWYIWDLLNTNMIHKAVVYVLIK